MYLVAWEYIVLEHNRSEFEKIYGAGGNWSRLFQKAPGYLGTELYRDEKAQQRYLTLDRWVSQAAYEAFMQGQRVAYEALDARCSDLTRQETRLGNFVRL